MNKEQANKILAKAVIDPRVEWDNEYTPPPKAGTTDRDRVNFFTNFNHNLLRAIREFKNQ